MEEDGTVVLTDLLTLEDVLDGLKNLIIFNYFLFLPQGEVSTLIFTVLHCGASGSLWKKPDLNPGPLAPQSGSPPMSHEYKNNVFIITIKQDKGTWKYVIIE